MAREPITYVSIEQDFCQESYGVSPCEASIGQTGLNKCYNTRATCQDAGNYNRGSLELFFGKKVSNNTKERYIIPSLESLSMAPTLLNPASSNQNSKPLGQRAQITVSFKDLVHSDLKVDPYRDERDFNPIEKGTFWSKWKARNPYYQNRKLTVYEGYEGELISEMQKKVYFIDEINGPDSNGNVSIKAKDILKLADDKKATAPNISTGELITDIASSGAITEIRVTGASGTVDYLPYTTVRIDKELFTYTGVSFIDDTEIKLTGVTRATDNSEMKAHSIGDRIQVCLRYTDERVDEITRHLLEYYGNIDSSYIDFTAWEDEADTWLNQFILSTLITEPTGVTELLGELTKQFLFYIWWNEKTQLIGFEAIKPVSDLSVDTFSDSNAIIADSVSIREDSKARFSQVWLFWNIREYTEKIDEESNYIRVSVRADLNAENENQYQEQKIHKIYSRWIDDEAQAENITARILSRFRNTQKTMTIEVDAKDRDHWTASLIDIEHRNYVDFLGDPKVDRWQIVSASEPESGHKVKLMLQLFEYGAGERFGKWMVDAAPVFSLATDVEKANGMWWCDDDGTFSDGSLGYNWT